MAELLRCLHNEPEVLGSSPGCMTSHIFPLILFIMFGGSSDWPWGLTCNARGLEFQFSVMRKSEPIYDFLINTKLKETKTSE